MHMHTHMLLSQDWLCVCGKPLSIFAKFLCPPFASALPLDEPLPSGCTCHLPRAMQGGGLLLRTSDAAAPEEDMYYSASDMSTEQVGLRSEQPGRFALRHRLSPLPA